jgi:ribosomal protein RSM22 (predicted rRNA methylase)
VAIDATRSPIPFRAQALPEPWIRAIDEAAAILLGPHDRRGEALAQEVARLSELYTRHRGALRTQSAVLAARLRFFLPRDLPKVEGPLAELAWAGALPRGPRWKVLDLGAGLGATTLGIATFAKRVPGIEGIDVVAVERDARALDVLAHLAARCGCGSLADVTVPVRLETRQLDLECVDLRLLGQGFSLITLGLTLNELWTERATAIEHRTALLAQCVSQLAEDGALIVIEPALRTSSRDLQRIRDVLAAGAYPGVYVFAPCTAAGPCPLLARERDWCHEELPLALPETLRPVARAAGLRWEGLSYAYLTLRPRPGSLAPGTTRIVGGPLRSKGRTEWLGCGDRGLVRIARLDRDRSTDALEGAQRGSLVRIGGTDGAHVRADRVRIERER